jgi:hypothetical protein
MAGNENKRGGGGRVEIAKGGGMAHDSKGGLNRGGSGIANQGQTVRDSAPPPPPPKKG